MRRPHRDLKQQQPQQAPHHQHLPPQDQAPSLVGWNQHSRIKAPVEATRESQLEASYREEEEKRQRRARINAMKKARLVAALKKKDVSFKDPGAITGGLASSARRGNKGGAGSVSFGPSVDLSTEAGRAMLNRQSINATMGKTARNKDTVKYLDYLEDQDKMVAKMEKVTSIKTKCVFCRTCNTITSTASAICLAQRHRVEDIIATKRFFECQHCGRRETTLNKKFMSTCCGKCGQAAWRRSSMRGGSKRVKKIGAGMQVRGAAHGTEFRGRAY